MILLRAIFITMPRSHQPAALAMIMVMLFLIMAMFAPWLAPYDPLDVAHEAMQAPGITHLLGTDHQGRDMLSRLIHGSRLSLQVAVAAVAVAMVIGSLLGLLAGYRGGWFDTIISRCLDALFALPEVFMALVIMAIFGVGLQQITLAIAIVYIPIFARICRSSVIQTRTQPYVEAAYAMGMSRMRIMFRHVLPAAAPALIVQTTLSLAFAILAESALSFLGLSGQSDAPSWGTMLQDGKDLMEQAWWIAVFPGMAIMLLVLSFNVLGDGLRDLLDPHQPG